MIEVTVLGSGVTAPNANRGEPGHHVKLDGAEILWDGGSGTRDRMLRAGLDQFALTHVFYSHLHTDHVSDMAPLLFSLRNTVDRQRTEDLLLTGPPGFQHYFDTLRGLSAGGRWWTRESYRVLPAEMHDGIYHHPAFSMRSLPVNHMEGKAVGYRLEDASGHVVAFSGDTGECDAIVELGRNADILLLECSWPDDQARAGHLTPRACGRVAKAAQPKHLVLVHMYPPCDRHDLVEEVGEVWGGRVTVGSDLQKLRIG